MRAVFVVPTLVAALLCPSMPGATAEERAVYADPPKYAFQRGADGRVFVSALCTAHASPDADQTEVYCEVQQSQWVLRVPDQSPVSPGGLIWNASYGNASGPFAAATWVGSSGTPATICTRAAAWFDRSGGEFEVVTATPACSTIDH